MTFEEYSRLSKEPNDATLNLSTLGIGLAGEVGEALNIIKKHLVFPVPLDVTKLADELGDVLWYLTALGELIDVPLETIAERNLVKLEKRYPERFRSKEEMYTYEAPS